MVIYELCVTALSVTVTAQTCDRVTDMLMIIYELCVTVLSVTDSSDM